MKVPTSIRLLYQEQKECNERLQKEVDSILHPIVQKNKWHYESRIKAEDSYFLKLESGRIEDPCKMEDFFACTIAVRNLSELDVAEDTLNVKFQLMERRPPSPTRTTKESASFSFDDVRLYMQLGFNDVLPQTGLEDILFEVQLKTFLQHACGIATHDLVYKTDNVSWSQQRIAYQVKAMLEHAEISIQEANHLAETAILHKSHDKTESIKQIIELLKRTWSSERLPKDLRRLAENVFTAMALLKISGVLQLKNLLDRETIRNKGELPTNISPYAIIVQAIVWHEHDSQCLLSRSSKKCNGKKLLLVAEMDLPAWLQRLETNNIIRVGND